MKNISYISTKKIPAVSNGGLSKILLQNKVDNTISKKTINKTMAGGLMQNYISRAVWSHQSMMKILKLKVVNVLHTTKLLPVWNSNIVMF